MTRTTRTLALLLAMLLLLVNNTPTLATTQDANVTCHYTPSQEDDWGDKTSTTLRCAEDPSAIFNSTETGIVLLCKPGMRQIHFFNDGDLDFAGYRNTKMRLRIGDGEPYTRKMDGNEMDDNSLTQRTWIYNHQALHARLLNAILEGKQILYRVDGDTSRKIITEKNNWAAQQYSKHCKPE